MGTEQTDPGSFRDPSGFVFHRGGEVFRQVNRSYREHYDGLIESGLYGRLTEAGLLVEHEEVAVDSAKAAVAYKILRPRRIDFLSYPYEWCFSQLKAAARTTLEAQKLALEHNMTLKDASAFNVQFDGGRPILIDTLSFERREEGAVWVGYRQFCQHFLAPLALAAYTGRDLRSLSLANLDGLPLDLASRLLPRRSWLRPGLLIHLHLHARSQQRHAGSAAPAGKKTTISTHQQLALVDSLSSLADRLTWRAEDSVWEDYYSATSYSAEEEKRKTRLVDDYLERLPDGPVLDLGANTGRYSRLAAEQGRTTISCDLDAAAVERNYLDCVDREESRILPLVVDLTNPTPAVGWAGRERASWIERFASNHLLALALVHHLAISNNVPLDRISDFLRRLGDWLVIEFVPKKDPQVQRLLASRVDVFPDYTREGFEAAFGSSWKIHQAETIGESGRRLYLMAGR